MNFEQLRMKVKRALIESNLDFYGNRKLLADAIGVNRQSLTMALTGYRESKRSKDILSMLLDYLKALSEEQATASS